MLEIRSIVLCSLIPISQNLISFAQFAKFRGIRGTGAIGMVHLCETVIGGLEGPGVTIRNDLQDIVIVEEWFAICHRNRPPMTSGFLPNAMFGSRGAERSLAQVGTDRNGWQAIFRSGASAE